MGRRWDISSTPSPGTTDNGESASITRRSCPATPMRRRSMSPPMPRPFCGPPIRARRGTLAAAANFQLLINRPVGGVRRGVADCGRYVLGAWLPMTDRRLGLPRGLPGSSCSSWRLHAAVRRWGPVLRQGTASKNCGPDDRKHYGAGAHKSHDTLLNLPSGLLIQRGGSRAGSRGHGCPLGETPEARSRINLRIHGTLIYIASLFGGPAKPILRYRP